MHDKLGFRKQSRKETSRNPQPGNDQCKESNQVTQNVKEKLKEIGETIRGVTEEFRCLEHTKLN
jgi:hypothetical protein